MVSVKKFFPFDDKPPVLYRADTLDQNIINEIMSQSSYIFPKFEPKVVYDIGANFGMASVILATLYPKAKIYAFEPVKENFDLLKQNVEYYPNVSPLNVALGAKTETKRIYKSDDPKNLGGFSLFIKAEEGEEVSVVSTKKVVEELGVPDLIKIDCEGAEYEILFNVPNIHKVAWITGELHGVNDYQLLHFLSPNFTFKIARNFHDKMWQFHALNNGWKDLSINPTLQE